MGMLATRTMHPQRWKRRRKKLKWATRRIKKQTLILALTASLRLLRQRRLWKRDNSLIQQNFSFDVSFVWATVQIYQERAGLPSHITAFLVYGARRRYRAPGGFLPFLFLFLSLLQHNIARRSLGIGMNVLISWFTLSSCCYIAGYGGRAVDCLIILF